MTYPSNQNAPPREMTPRELAIVRAVGRALDARFEPILARLAEQEKEIAALRLALAEQRGDMLAAMLSVARQPEGVRHDA